jgi:tuftelin-interacting protein 11
MSEPPISESDVSLNSGSFGARMMEKMGYKEGQGLGKQGTGRIGIIEVRLRPRGVGLGAVDDNSANETIEISQGSVTKKRKLSVPEDDEAQD